MAAAGSLSGGRDPARAPHRGRYRAPVARRFRNLALAAGLVVASSVAAVDIGAAAPGVGRAPATPACFGAAARDPARPCDNPALRFRASPAPELALLQPNSPCTVAGGTPPFCVSGVPKARAARTVALIGDSHAGSWRAAVEVAARAERWRLLTLRRSSCPFILAPEAMPRAVSDRCARWVAAALERLRGHPEITTVFIANSANYAFTGEHAAGVAGYRTAFAALPATVRQIVVLRDNPKARFDTLDCVAEAVARHRRADQRCALPRSSALLPDAATDAATPQATGGRAGVIDLTRFFCDDTRCLPVVGGALVYKDSSHLTATFAGSLGPYLLSAYRALNLPPA